MITKFRQNYPETNLIADPWETSLSPGQILWQDWLKLPQPTTDKLGESLRQMWGLLYWQEHLIAP
jgi:hypothetical protein